MPRYYFDLLDGTTECDAIGAVLDNDGAARQEAMLRAINGSAHQIAHYKGSEEIAVRNETGDIIYTTIIKRKALERS